LRRSSVEESLAMRSLCGFAASRAESLWLSVALQRGRGFASGGVAAKRAEGLTESRRLSAREAAKPPKPLHREAAKPPKPLHRGAAEPQITSYFFLRHLRYIRRVETHA